MQIFNGLFGKFLSFNKGKYQIFSKNTGKIKQNLIIRNWKNLEHKQILPTLVHKNHTLWPLSISGSKARRWKIGVTAMWMK